MIADSPYKMDRLILRPVIGFIAGVLGTIVMMGSFFALQPLSGRDLDSFLASIAALILPGEISHSNLTLSGAVFILFIGGLFGLLYALCQHQIPSYGLVFVGLFYGLILWILNGLLIGLLSGETIRSILHSWTFLLCTLVYGLCLSFVSIIWSVKRQPVASVVLPKD